MIPPLLLLLGILHYSHQTCHHTTSSFYRLVSDDLWAVQKLRESIFSSLRDTRSNLRSYEAHFAVTTILDGLRRRTIDLYPMLDDLPKLRSLNPMQQTDWLLEMLTDQRHIGCAAEIAHKELRRGKLTVDKNITIGLDYVQPHNRATCFNEIIDIFWSYLCTCPPTQQLIGAILVNIPIRMSSSDARLQVSNLLRQEAIPPEEWRESLDLTDPSKQTLTAWLAHFIAIIANYTRDPETTESVATSIIQIDPEITEDDSQESDEQVTFRLHPKNLEAAGFYVQTSKADKGIFRLRPSAESQKESKPDVSEPPRVRRDAIRTTTKIVKHILRDKGQNRTEIFRRYLGPQKMTGGVPKMSSHTKWQTRRYILN